MKMVFIKTNRPGSLMRRIYNADPTAYFASHKGRRDAAVIGRLLTGTRVPGGVAIHSDTLEDICSFMKLGENGCT